MEVHLSDVNITRKIRRVGRYYLPIALVLLVLVVGAIQPLFLTLANIVNVAKQTAFIAIFAFAQMLPILTGGLDLSQGGIIALVSVLFALYSNQIGTGNGALIALLFGVGAGLANGIVIARLHVSPFIVTLGLMSILQGTALVLSNGQPVYEVPPEFAYLGANTIAGIPYPTAAATLVFTLLTIFLNQTIWGRYIYAVGSNERAAVLAGIDTRSVKILVYGLSAALTSVGSLLLSSRINSGHPTVGANVALESVAAVIIGGVSLFGGQGSVGGVLWGALLLGILSNALNLLNVSSYYQLIAVGCTIILAVVVDRLKVREVE